MHTAFISHSSRDAEGALSVVRALEQVGISCWIAPRNVSPGEDFASEIMRGIEISNFFVLLLSASSITSQHVLREVGRAASKQKRIIVFRVEHVRPTQGLEYIIGGLHWIDAFRLESDAALEELRNAITSATSLEAAIVRPFPEPAVSSMVRDPSIQQVAHLSRLGFDAVSVVSDRTREQGSLTAQDLLAALQAADRHSYSSLSAADLVRLLKDADNHGFCPGLEKKRGGYAVREAHISFKTRTEADTKARLAKTVAATVRSGMSLGLDGGSTTLAVFDEVISLIETEVLEDITFVTNSMSIIARACSFTADRGISDITCPFRVYVIGGRLRIVTAAVAGLTNTSDIDGPGEVELSNILRETGALDLALVGANGVTLEGGLTIPTPDEIPMKRALLKAAKNPTVVADGSKFGVRFEHELATWDGSTRLLTSAPTTAQGLSAWQAIAGSDARQWIDMV